jgi:aryl-alcohol dehydrogenase-like predicted oxidoreductase
VNQRIGGQARGAATDPVRWRAGTPVHVSDDDFTIGRNQYQHDRWGAPPDRHAALATLHRLPEIGVNFTDTADSYGPDISEV